MSTEKFYRVNDKIRFSPVVLIDSDGKNLGPISLFRAKEIAFNKNLDLVEVSPNSKPPVCKVMDFGKFKYEQEKKNKNCKKTVQIKEVRLSVGIADHDIDTKSKSVIRFLTSGHKVDIKLELKRKEENHRILAKQVLDKFLSKFIDFGKVAKDPVVNGRFLFCTIEPNRPQDGTKTSC